jgi:hypothetical protein
MFRVKVKNYVSLLSGDVKTVFPSEPEANIRHAIRQKLSNSAKILKRAGNAEI